MPPPQFPLAATRRAALFITLAITATVLVTACKSPPSTAAASTNSTTAQFQALHTPHPIPITGSLEDPIWAHTPAFPMNAMNDAEGHRLPLHEGGMVRFAWDEKFLYLAVDFTDSDVRTSAKDDGLPAYRLGDVCELFLKPANQPCYWELYVTPNNHQTTYLWPNGSPAARHSSDALQRVNRLIVAAHINGTLNDDKDRDQGWTAQMAVPWDMLKFHDQRFGPQTAWHVLVGRYNYSAYILDSPEFSSAPPISKRDYHLTQEYAPLILQKP